MFARSAVRFGAAARRAGFALPLSILALALVTASIVASYTATSAETVANNAMRAQDHAYQLAESGLQQFLLRRSEGGFCSNCVPDPAAADSEWTRVNLAGGYADVVATRVRPKLSETVPALFFVRSTGVDTTVRMSGAGSAVYATRTLGQYATFGTAAIRVAGALTSLAGVSNAANPNHAPVLGADLCSLLPTGPAIVVPTGGQYEQVRLTAIPVGIPPVDSSMTIDSLRKRIAIDWSAIVNSDALPADATVPPPGRFPTSAMFSDTSYWPVIRVKSSFTVPVSGRGLIIADNDLTITGNTNWDGIILVGGRLTASGSGIISGMVVSGLRLALPGAVNPANNTTTDNDQLDQTRVVSYSSCNTQRALQRLRMYFAWSNTWLDNVAVW